MRSMVAWASAIAAFADVEVVRGARRIVWEWIGEGVSGDYDPAIAGDVPLLRFSCAELVGMDWEEMDSASYCTNMTVEAPRDRLIEVANKILDALEQDSYRHDLEYLSHLGDEPDCDATPNGGTNAGDCSRD